MELLKCDSCLETIDESQPEWDEAAQTGCCPLCKALYSPASATQAVRHLSRAGEPPSLARCPRFCPQCGTSLAAGGRYCPECGASVIASADTATARARSEPGDVSVGAIAASYIVGAIVPVIGWAMAIYLLVKGRVAHAMAVAVLAIFMAYFWIALLVNPLGRGVLPHLIGLPPPVVTKAEYDRIEEGMTYEQVKRTIGASGEELSRSDIAGYSTVMYSWTNANRSNMNAMFQNGRLVNKAQFGLP